MKFPPIKVISFHVLFWVLYIVSEYFANLMHIRPGEHLNFFKSLLLTLPVLLLPTYFITGYVVPRYLTTQQWTKFIAWVIGVGLFVFFIRIKYTEWIYYLESGEYFKMPASKLLKNIIRDYAIIALGVCITIIGDYRRKQQQNELLIKANAEAEIKLLKEQLHPHFLFNSLNNIYSLALTKSDLTAESILKLTELLDYLLYRANQDKVPIIKEVQLLEHYIDLEKLRYGHRLEITTSFSIADEQTEMPPLLFLPFAENCFKHGGPGKDGIFRIHMELDADKTHVRFKVMNSKRVDVKSSRTSGGIGLDNIRKRLNLLFPGRHVLSITDASEDFTVELEINDTNA